ncbi:POK25 protein, partial [Melanocharis versteri]|nr:POK25 protein [Melanocharis versteri]
FIAEGNRRADQLAAVSEFANLPQKLEQAKLSHALFYQNALALTRMFSLSRSQARAIVATCPTCQKHQVPSFGRGVNPRGLNTCEVWQMDVTHIPEFGRQKYVHVSVDTFSGMVFASAH